MYIRYSPRNSTVKNNNAKVKKEQKFNKLWEQKFEIEKRAQMTNDEKSQMAVLDDELTNSIKKI